MKIGIVTIADEDTGAFFAAQVRARKHRVGDGLELSFFPAHGPSQFMETEVDEALAAPAILAAVEAAAGELCEAIVIDCVLDPALQACRHLVDVPVVGAGQAALACATMLGERVTVLVHNSCVTGILRRNLKLYGFLDRVVAFRPLQIPVLRMGLDEGLEDAVLEAASLAVAEDACDVLVLGCTGLAPVAEKLQAASSVPVVEPALAAMHMARTLAALSGRRRGE